MSTNILGELDKMLGGNEGSPNCDRQPEDLASYVKRIMSEKRLSLRQVAATSQGGITQGYVGGIVKGHYRNLTVDKVKALAKGLRIGEDDLFRVLRSKSTSELPLAPELAYYLRVLDLTKLIITDLHVFELLRLYMDLTAGGQESAIKAMKILLQEQKSENVRAI